MLSRLFLAGVCACFVFPVWAETLPKPSVLNSTPEYPLSLSHHSVPVMNEDLSRFIESVWAASPSVKAAQSELDVLLARKEGADQPLYNPNLILDAERSGVNTTVVGFNQTLDWSDQRDAQRQVAHKRVLMARAALKQVKQQVAVDTLSALAEYATAEQMQVLAVYRAELIQRFMDTVKQRQLAGDMGALEGLLAQVTYSEVLMQQAAVESQLAEAKAALQSVTGLVLTEWPALPVLPTELALPTVQTGEAHLKSLPELIALFHRIEAAKLQVVVTERVNRVAPIIGVRAGREGDETLLGVSLEIPLFVRNNFQADVRARDYEVTREEQLYNVAYRRAKARLDGSFGRYQSTAKAWQVWLTEGQLAQQEQGELLEKMWQAGELTATDYLVQAKQRLETQKMAMELMGEVWQAAIAWLDASGQINDWLNIHSPK
ncbi:hypothetical protein MNBD_GAMMA04-1920 [hydrothermal vent metagenome]|uniref:Heavy metal RND efflux outer membrane protein, CzcC family n=1 Tax=hydrothermal vent metagenome TaxID=652676 RepID=A0A3B0W029_9ZZZZ